MMKKIYYYDKNTFNYIGSGPANLDPVATQVTGEEVYARPRYSTFVEPPAVKLGEQPVYDASTDSWKAVKSNKGSYKLNANTGLISKIEDNEPLKSYECIVAEEVLEDVKENPIKYSVIDGKLVNISKVQKYQTLYNIRKYKKAIQEAKEAYVIFRETPVKWQGATYLPRYLEDYAGLLSRAFPMEIWDSTGTKSTLMSKAELQALYDYLDDLDKTAYSIKKYAIKKYKAEIEKLGGEND